MAPERILGSPEVFDALKDCHVAMHARAAQSRASMSGYMTILQGIKDLGRSQGEKFGRDAPTATQRRRRPQCWQCWASDPLGAPWPHFGRATLASIMLQCVAGSRNMGACREGVWSHSAGECFSCHFVCTEVGDMFPACVAPVPAPASRYVAATCVLLASENVSTPADTGGFLILTSWILK